MEYQKFVEKAVLEDNRNRFATCSDCATVPVALQPFYSRFNPVDVEVSFESLGAVMFYPAGKLAEVQDDYGLPSGHFVFASCNADPIFVKDGCVYTSMHDCFRPELLAPSFDAFLEMYINA